MNGNLNSILVVIPEDQCRIKREAKQKIKLETETFKMEIEPNLHEQSTPDALSSEANELIERLLDLEQEYLIFPDDISHLLENVKPFQ